MCVCVCVCVCVLVLACMWYIRVCSILCIDESTCMWVYCAGLKIVDNSTAKKVLSFLIDNCKYCIFE